MEGRRMKDDRYTGRIEVVDRGVCNARHSNIFEAAVHDCRSGY